MYKNKLIQHLLSFSRKEMTRFKEYCHSPYFNKHDQVRALMNYLSAIYPQFDEKKCERSLLYQKVFVTGEFDQAKLALVFTYAQKCMEQFIAQEQFEKDHNQKTIFLLKGLLAHTQYTTFEKALKKNQRSLLQSELRNAAHYFHAYQLTKYADDYYNLLDRRRVDNSLELKQNNLDNFYLLEKLKDACEAKIRQSILKVDYQTRFKDLLLKEIKASWEHYQTFPTIVVFYKIYQMLDEKQIAVHYYEASSYFNQHKAAFTKIERASIYIYFLNYCISRINQGDSIFLKEVFEIYKAQLEQGFLHENGELSEWDYKNIVTTGIRLGDLDWVYHFIEHYKEELSVESKDNAYRFNLASYYYANGSYGKVLDLLIRVEYSDLRYNTSAKALLLRTYFDLEEYEPLNALTESFRQYLLRNKTMSDARRAGFNNLFKLTRKLAGLKSKLNFTNIGKMKKDLKKLELEIQQTDLLYNRDWVMEKVAQLNTKLEKS